MNTFDWIGIVSMVIVILSFIFWFKNLKAVRVPRFRAHYFAIMIIAFVLGLSAMIKGESWIVKIPLFFALNLAAVFIIVRFQSYQGDNVPTVAVGDKMINFAALDGEGNTFDSASMAGKPYLFKFFRGFW